MKLDKIKFARVIAHCVSNGMTAGQFEVEHLDSLIDVEAPESTSLIAAEMKILLAAMQAGKKIEAIKQYRSMTGFGLKESKDIIEQCWIADQQFISANKLQDQMLDSLNKSMCSIPEENKLMVRDFISSFNTYKSS